MLWTKPSRTLRTDYGICMRNLSVQLESTMLTKSSEEHIMGERLDDGKIYIKRRVDRSPNRSPR